METNSPSYCTTNLFIRQEMQHYKHKNACMYLSYCVCVHMYVMCASRLCVYVVASGDTYLNTQIHTIASHIYCN